MHEQSAEEAGGEEDESARRTPASPTGKLPSPGGGGAKTVSRSGPRSFIASMRGGSRHGSSSGSTSSSITEDQRFHRWCKEGKLAKVSDALSKGGDIDGLLKKRVGVYGYTPLHEAASYGHDEILRVSVLIMALVFGLSVLVYSYVGRDQLKIC